MNKLIAFVILILCLSGFVYYSQILSKKGTETPYTIGGNDRYRVYSSKDFGEEGEVLLHIINTYNNTVFANVNFAFPYGVTGVVLYENKAENYPFFALSEGTSTIRALYFFDAKTGALVGQSVCHASVNVILYKDEVFYGDCTKSEELEKEIADATESNLVKRNILTAEETILRKAGPMESYAPENLLLASIDSTDSSTENKLLVLKYTYNTLTEEEKEQLGVPVNIITEESREEIVLE